LSPASPFATASPSQAGLLDIPFAAGRHSRGEVMVARDAEGKVRYLDPRPPD
jgi:glutamate mutase epsilon subunit